MTALIPQRASGEPSASLTPPLSMTTAEVKGLIDFWSPKLELISFEGDFSRPCMYKREGDVWWLLDSAS